VKATDCAVEGCPRPSHTRGWCQTHYARWRRHGDAGPAEILKVEHIDVCTVEDCSERGQMRRGMCNNHYRRLLRYGTPTPTDEQRSTKGERCSRWLGDAVDYGAVHRRIKMERGPAKVWPCQHCGDQAAHWAYDHTDPNEKVSDRGRYSTDPDHYIPLCHRCHVKFDDNNATGWATRRRRQIEGDGGMVKV